MIKEERNAEIVDRRYNGASAPELAQQFNISVSRVNQIIRQENAHGPRQMKIKPCPVNGLDMIKNWLAREVAIGRAEIEEGLRRKRELYQGYNR